MKALLLILLLVSPAWAKENTSLNGMTAPDEKIVRTWQSSDGKTLDAELLEYSDTEIKVKNTKSFQIVKIPLTRLAEADREFVMNMVKENSIDFSLTHGSYAKQITGELVKAESKEGLLYQIYGDPKWDGKQRYPLLIWLHGAGQSGNDNQSQLAGSPKALYNKAAQEKHPCIVLMPQCPDRAIGWKDQVADNLMTLINDMCANLPVDKDRIYLTGSSMGGFGTWGMITKWPDVFACAVPLCGGGDPSKAAIIKDVPIWIFHGDKDDQVSIDFSRKMFAALQAVKSTAQFTELPGAGHIITEIVYPKPELDEWMFKQRRVPQETKKGK